MSPLLLLLACRDPEPAAPELPGDLLVVSETSSGRLLFVDQQSGLYLGELCLSELLPDDCVYEAETMDEQCLLFASEPSYEDGVSRWLITYQTRDSTVRYSPSGVASVRAGHPPALDWKIDEISFEAWLPDYRAACVADPDNTEEECHLNAAHAALWDRGLLLVADTTNSRALWLEPPVAQGEPAEVVAVLGLDHPDWLDWRNLNHIQLLEEDARTLLLTTFKSSWVDNHTEDQGGLALWDVSDLDAIERVWVYPEDGYLAAVHHGMVQTTADGQTLLVYAHSLGASEDAETGLLGSVGLARYNGTTPPTYLADGVYDQLPYHLPLGFVREVEIPHPYNWLLITDSGCENKQADCSFPGRVLAVSLPELEPAGTTGALGDQRFIDLAPLQGAYEKTLVYPYEADVLYAEQVEPEILEGLGPCTP